MSKRRKPYPPEFRRQIVELVWLGRIPELLAQEFEPTAESIRNRGRPTATRGAVTNGLASPERRQLRGLRRENRRLRLEREILAKATVWFAWEIDLVPPKSSIV